MSKDLMGDFIYIIENMSLGKICEVLNISLNQAVRLKRVVRNREEITVKIEVSRLIQLMKFRN